MPPTVEEILGPEPQTVESILGPPPTGQVEPPPFQIDRFIDSVGEERGFPVDATERDGLSSALWPLARPFLAQGYNAVSALNRGTAHFYEGLDLAAEFLANRTGIERGKLFEKIAKESLDKADHWQKRAQEVGINFFDELISDAIGGFPGGVAGFALDVGSVFTLPAMRGFARAERTGENPFVTALLEAAQTKTLHMMFKAIAPLKKYLSGPLMGTIFGVQEAAVAPEGEAAKGFAKGFGTGLGYSILSPGGQMGLGELIKDARVERALRPEVRIPEKDVIKNEPEVDLLIGKKERFVEPPKPPTPSGELIERGEYRKLIDAETGELLAESSKGRGTKEELSANVDIPEFGNFLKRKVIDEHTHPDKSMASAEDLAMFGWSHVEKVRIKIPDGTIYEYSRPEKLKITPKEMKDIWNKADNELFKADKLKELSVDDYIAEVNKRVLEETGITLKIIEPPKPPIAEPGKVGGERTLAEQFPAQKGEPEIRPTKFWETVAEAKRTAPESQKLMKEVQAEEPIVNIVQPNRMNLEKAYKTLEEKGAEETFQHTLKGEGMTPVEKGALFNVLMEKAQKQGDWAKFVEIMDNYSLYLVDLGRGVQIASVWSKSTPMGFIKWAQKQLDGVNKKYGWADTLLGRKKAVLTEEDKINISKEFMQIQKMPEGIEKSNEMMKLIDQIAVKVPPGVSAFIDAGRYQNMLCGPQTQERNIMWNMTNTFITRPIDLATSGGIDYVVSALRGKERQSYVSDAPLYLKEAINVIPNALTGFKNVWKQEAGEIMAKPDLGVEYKTPFEKARAKQIPKALTVVQRFMEASDKFNSMLIASGEKAIQMKRGVAELEAEIKAKAIAEKYLVRDKLDPSDPSLSYFSKAIEGLGVLVQEGRHLPVIGTPLSWFVPFIRTPIKVGVQMIERSPLGWARGNIDLESASKLVSGAAVTGLGALFAYIGETTWAPPSDEKAKEWFYSSGKKPFSFKIGEKWVPAWYLGPYALAFMFPAAIKHYTEETKESLTDGSLEKLGNIAEGIARFISSQTSAQSIGNFFSFMAGDIDYNLKNQIGFTIGQFIPLSAMVRYVNKAIDPVFRKAEGVWEQTIKNIPFLSEELPARTKPYGEESRREFFNLFIPYDVGVTDDIYESMFPLNRINERGKYLINKMKQLEKKMDKGDMREKHFEEMIKIMKAAPKVFE